MSSCERNGQKRKKSGFRYSHNLYYVNSCCKKNAADDCEKSDNSADKKQPVIVHLSSPEHENYIKIIKWCYAVAGIPADSPRFAHYVSRWRVPDKIAAAESADTLETTLSKCPPIDPSWIRLVPAALDEYKRFVSEFRAFSTQQAAHENNKNSIAA